MVYSYCLSAQFCFLCLDQFAFCIFVIFSLCRLMHPRQGVFDILKGGETSGVFSGVSWRFLNLFQRPTMSTFLRPSYGEWNWASDFKVSSSSDTWCILLLMLCLHMSCYSNHITFNISYLFFMYIYFSSILLVEFFGTQSFPFLNFLSCSIFVQFTPALSQSSSNARMFYHYVLELLLHSPGLIGSQEAHS